MAAIPVKPEYGPTLGHMLEPRWRRAGSVTRALVVAAGAAPCSFSPPPWC